MKVLVTGGAGFIGSNITLELVNRNFRVIVLDDLSTGRLENLKELKSKIRFVKGDIRNSALLKKLFRGVDYILHQAALPSVPRSINNPKASHDVNVNGTFQVLLAAHDAKVKRVVLASSSSIYGNRKHFGYDKIKFKREAMKAMPLSPYAVNKLVGEEYAKVISHIYGLKTVCLRYFNVFGPHQNPKSEYAAVIPKFITAMLKNSQPVIHGDGTQSRDFTYVENVVQANLLAMTSPQVGKGETINIACGKSTSLLELVNHLNRILHKNLKPKFDQSRPGDVKNSLADITKAEKLLGYQPKVNFVEGLKKTTEWYK
ncbi:SDR family oxidoreductase [Candidatus Parcubacteria bacterium]|jgi:UDP-glucose 4-epimerase|nr:MAG: SDR family oxidoreductase [Candidatus Parcubacteria bacterium]